MSLNMKLMLVFAVLSSVIGAFGVIALIVMIKGLGDVLFSLAFAGWVASLVLLVAAAVKWIRN